MPLNRLLARLSFRVQIALLGTVVVVLLVALLTATFSALSYTKPSMLLEEKRGLFNSATTLARAYSDKSSSEGDASVPLLDQRGSESEAQLTTLSRGILQSVGGAEGGFYSPALNNIAGFAFPTQGVSSESSNQDSVAKEFRNDVFQVAKQAVETHKPSERVVTETSDLVLIEAVPILEHSVYTGSAWTMKRLPILPGTNRFRAYVIAVALGIAALSCVLLTLFLVRNLQDGVRRIESGLKGLEGDLSLQLPISDEPEEIHRIIQAVNRLGAALKSNIEREKQIEDQLRHTERLAALGRLVAGVAHEVRNPLATIRLRLQMCSLESDKPGVHESCAIALEEIERLNGMVNRLLSFAQPIHLQPEPTDLKHLAQQRLNGFLEKAQMTGIHFVTDFNDGEGVLRVDRSRMAQVFDNLIQNAIEAMAESGGTLWVSVAAEKKTAPGTDRIRVEFRDTGKGVSTNTISRIFDPFFTTKPSGTGLGLSICHELVRAHDGEIHVESGEGKGTSVRIILPVRDGVGRDIAV